MNISQLEASAARIAQSVKRRQDRLALMDEHTDSREMVALQLEAARLSAQLAIILAQLHHAIQRSYGSIELEM